MPQLDHVSYFSQFFWVSILFLTFYIILVTSLLPKVATILKIRKKLTIVSDGGVTSSMQDQVQSSSYENVLASGVKETKNILADVSSRSAEWVRSTSNQLSSSNLSDSHTKYVESIADILSKKYVIQSLLNK